MIDRCEEVPIETNESIISTIAVERKPGLWKTGCNLLGHKADYARIYPKATPADNIKPE
jgi:hypothetical protein